MSAMRSGSAGRAPRPLRIQEERERLAEARRELASIRHERGLADNLDVVEAEEELSRSRTGRISALIDLKIARARADRAAGRLAERFGHGTTGDEDDPEGPVGIYARGLSDPTRVD